MPSPITHVAIGYVIFRAVRARIGEIRPGLVWACVGLSILPDIDAVIGFLAGDVGRFHNQMMNSPAFAVLAAAAVGGIGWWRASEFRFWFNLALACYLIHFALDYLTVGRGLMLFWPLSEERFPPPFTLFYGLHWSKGWISESHLYTLFSEIATLLVVWLMLRLYEKNRAGND